MKEQEETKREEPGTKKRKLDLVLLPPPKFEVGHMVIFHKQIDRSPFGIGQILEMRPNGVVHFQWFGNYYNANGKFEAGWKNLREDLGYYGRKISRLDVPWTGEHTEEKILTTDLVIASGPDFLGEQTAETPRSADAKNMSHEHEAL